MVAVQEAAIRTSVALLRSALLRCLASPAVDDLVFIGNSGDSYEWVPSRIVDFDCFIFAPSFGPAAGEVLLTAAEWTKREVNTLGVDFELRLIRGAYKPDRLAEQPPIICAHIGLFDDARYQAQPVLSRWSWKKYRCIIEPGRLLRLAPPSPNIDDLINGPRGAHERLLQLQARSTTMTEYRLPTLRESRLDYGEGTAQFVEFCFSSAASCARHHARILGHSEADTLGNTDFYAWYQANVMTNEALADLIALKARSRNAGFGGLGVAPRNLAIEYLQALIERCAQL